MENQEILILKKIKNQKNPIQKMKKAKMKGGKQKVALSKKQHNKIKIY